MSLSQQLWLCYYAVHLRNEVLLIEVESLISKKQKKTQRIKNAAISVLLENWPTAVFLL